MKRLIAVATLFVTMIVASAQSAGAAVVSPTTPAAPLSGCTNWGIRSADTVDVISTGTRRGAVQVLKRTCQTPDGDYVNQYLGRIILDAGLPGSGWQALAILQSADGRELMCRVPAGGTICTTSPVMQDAYNARIWKYAIGAVQRYTQEGWLNYAWGDTAKVY